MGGRPPGTGFRRRWAGGDDHDAGDRRAHGGRTQWGASAPRGGPINTVEPAADGAPFAVILEDGAEEGQLVARVRGELDGASNPQLQQTLLQALRRTERLLTLDLSGVTFFGSAGVTALVWLSQHPEAAGKHVAVIATSRIVTGPLELTGLLERLDVQGMSGPLPRPGDARPSTGG